jgi:hypothetical protein
MKLNSPDKPVTECDPDFKFSTLDLSSNSSLDGSDDEGWKVENSDDEPAPRKLVGGPHQNIEIDCDKISIGKLQQRQYEIFTTQLERR